PAVEGPAGKQDPVLGAQPKPAPGLRLILGRELRPIDPGTDHHDPARRHAPALDDGRAEVLASGNDHRRLTEIAARGAQAEPVPAGLERTQPAPRRHRLDDRRRRDPAPGAPRGELARMQPTALEHHAERRTPLLDESAERTGRYA